MTTVPVDILREMLEANGIACVVKNRALSVAAGEVPPIETWPSLWVVDDAQADEALRLVETVMRDEDVGDPWTCAHCGAEVDGHFAACWQCSRVPETIGPDDPVVAETARDYERLGERTRALSRLLWMVAAIAALFVALGLLWAT